MVCGENIYVWERENMLETGYIVLIVVCCVGTCFFACVCVRGDIEQAVNDCFGRGRRGPVDWDG